MSVARISKCPTTPSHCRGSISAVPLNPKFCYPLLPLPGAWPLLSPDKLGASQRGLLRIKGIHDTVQERTLTEPYSRTSFPWIQYPQWITSSLIQAQDLALKLACPQVVLALNNHRRKKPHCHWQSSPSEWEPKGLHVDRAGTSSRDSHQVYRSERKGVVPIQHICFFISPC